MDGEGRVNRAVPPGRRRRALVNEAFRPQRVTGQQRYARELSDRITRHDGIAPVAPAGWWARGSRVWGWALAVLPLRARGRVLVSLTSRAPLWHRRHVVVVHDLFVLTDPAWYSRRYVWTHAPLLRAHLRSASAIVAVSEPVAEQVRAHTRAPVRVAPNAPSELFARGAAADGVLAARGLRRRGYLLTVGSLDPRKNLRRLAAAYGRLTTAERAAMPLVVVGGGSAIYADDAIDWPGGAVRTGYVDDAELAQLYRGAAGVVFPSLAEGFGLPVVEAAVAGAPLAVSDIPVFHWILADAPAAYLDPTDVDSISAALRRLADGEVPALDDTAAAALTQRFSWDASAAVLADAVREVAVRA